MNAKKAKKLRKMVRDSKPGGFEFAEEGLGRKRGDLNNPRQLYLHPQSERAIYKRVKKVVQ